MRSSIVFASLGLWIIFALTPVTARADDSASFTSRVDVHDLDGGDGSWQEGTLTVQAPIAVVEDWMNNYEKWPERFPDITSAKIVKDAGNGETVVRFDSKILEREMTCDMHVTGHKVVYTGEGKNVTVQGKLFFEAFGPNQTRVIIQTASRLHGLLRMIPHGTQRNRARKKIRADLGALVVLEQKYVDDHKR